MSDVFEPAVLNTSDNLELSIKLIALTVGYWMHALKKVAWSYVLATTSQSERGMCNPTTTVIERLAIALDV